MQHRSYSGNSNVTQRALGLSPGVMPQRSDESLFLCEVFTLLRRQPKRRNERYLVYSHPKKRSRMETLTPLSLRRRTGDIPGGVQPMMVSWTRVYSCSRKKNDFVRLHVVIGLVFATIFNPDIVTGRYLEPDHKTNCTISQMQRARNILSALHRQEFRQYHQHREAARVAAANMN